MDRASPRRRGVEIRPPSSTDISNPADRTARRARQPTASRLRIDPRPPPFSRSRLAARQCRFQVRTGRISSRCTQRHRRRLYELEHEAIGLAAMLKDVPAAIVLRMPQRGGCACQLEAGLLDVLDQKIFVDSMQGRGFSLAAAGLPAVIDNSVNPALLERFEYLCVHVLAIQFEADHVVIVEMYD